MWMDSAMGWEWPHQGSIAFGIGLFLVLIGWPVLGMMGESYGFVALFRFVNSVLRFYIII